MAIPQLQQFFCSSSNPAGVGGDTGSAFKFTLRNAVGANNCLVLDVTAPSGTTIAISDNNSNTWPVSATVSADAGAGAYLHTRWVLPGANAGVTTITIGVGATAIQPVSWECSEWNNIATTSPVDGTASAANQSGATLATGSFTPGTNGDLILASYYPAGTIGANPTSFAAAAGFTLLQADIAWNSKQGFPKASQFEIQSSAAAINPTITINGDATDGFNCIACALKTASAGTQYTGMRILKYIEQTCNALASGTWVLQTPAMGNLRFFGTTVANSGVPINSVTDSESNTLTLLSAWSADSCQGAFLQNSAVNQNLKSTINWGAGATGNGLTVAFYDIIGAATSGQPGAVASKGLTGANNATTIADMPDITPTSSAGSLIIYLMNNQGAGAGTGPTFNITAPTGALSDMVAYTGKTGASQFDFGDGYGHLNNNTSTAPQSVAWTLAAVASNSLSGAAVEFLPAPSGSVSTAIFGAEQYLGWYAAA